MYVIFLFVEKSKLIDLDLINIVNGSMRTKQISVKFSRNERNSSLSSNLTVRDTMEISKMPFSKRFSKVFLPKESISIDFHKEAFSSG